jgi:hypothetical protein
LPSLEFSLQIIPGYSDLGFVGTVRTGLTEKLQLAAEESILLRVTAKESRSKRVNIYTMLVYVKIEYLFICKALHRLNFFYGIDEVKLGQISVDLLLTLSHSRNPFSTIAFE